MWAAGILASISSISYPAISAFVSTHADADKQGLVQVIAMLTRQTRSIPFSSLVVLELNLVFRFFFFICFTRG